MLKTRVLFQGGLGNQLFQIAAGELLRERGIDVYYDDVLLTNPPPGTTVRKLAVRDLIHSEELVHGQLDRTTLLRLQAANRLKIGIIEQDGGEWTRLISQRYVGGGVLGYFQDPVLVDRVWPAIKLRIQAAVEWESVRGAQRLDQIAIHYRVGDYRFLPDHGVLMFV